MATTIWGTPTNNVLELTVADGPLTWRAGAGYDVLSIDFSLATAYVFASAGSNSFSFHATQWADSDFVEAIDTEAVSVIGSRYNDYFIGGAQNDTLKGGEGDDVLNPGKGGSDLIDGGAGFDKIEFDYSAIATTVVYDATQAATSAGGKLFNGTVVKNVEGIATLRTGSDADKLIVATGTKDFVWWAGAGSDVLIADYSAATAAITVTMPVTPDGVMTRITGASMSEGFGGRAYGLEQLLITGTRFSDSIQGTFGHDRLDGGAGADRLEGLKGDDTYIVQDGKDVVVELADQGTDTVIASVTWQLGANLEHLTLTGSGALNGLGNALDNAIIGNSGQNILTGGAGNDTLDGGASGDNLIGGLGDDVYYVDSINDVVVESTGQGTDTVYASVSFTLSDTNASENLVLTGSGHLSATGNSLDNRLDGNSGNNQLSGGAGNDRLDGRAGVDTLVGGLGNDTFLVDNIGDVVTELNGQGNDLIQSTVTYSLSGRYVEHLRLAGTEDINAFGNDVANRLTGNAGDNRLVGGRGNDTLTGGLGADDFAFAAGSGKDVITDFHASEGDVLNLNAYHAKATAVITQVGSSTVVDLGGGNVITLTDVSATDPAFLSHIIW